MGVEIEVVDEFGGYPWSLYPVGYIVGFSSIGPVILAPATATTPWPGFTYMRPAILDEPETTRAQIRTGLRVLAPPPVVPRMTCAALPEIETTRAVIRTGYVVAVVAATVVITRRIFPVALTEPESTSAAVRQGFAPRPPPQLALRPAALTESETTPARITTGFRVFPPPPQVFPIRQAALTEPDTTPGIIRSAFVVTTTPTASPQVVRVAPVALEEPPSTSGKISAAFVVTQPTPAIRIAPAALPEIETTPARIVGATPLARRGAPTTQHPVELYLEPELRGRITVGFAVAVQVVAATPAIRITPAVLGETDTTRPMIAAGPKVDPPPPVVPRLRAAALEEPATTTPRIVVGFFVPPPPPVILGFVYRPAILDTDGHYELPASIRPRVGLGFDIPVAPPEPPNTGLINGGGNPSRARRRKPFNVTSRDSVANRDRARAAARRALERQVEQELQALRDDADLARAPRVVLSGDDEAVIILMLL